jgi:hypothetical protein
LKRLAQENGVIYTLYIQKEEMDGTKNDHATRISPGQLSLVRAFSLMFCREGRFWTVELHFFLTITLNRLKKGTC